MSLDISRVGLWWRSETDDLWAKSSLVKDGYSNELYIQYDPTITHKSCWNNVVWQYLEGPKMLETIKKGCQHLEKGSVIYNCTTGRFEIHCSEEIAKDTDFINQIIQYFGLVDRNFDILFPGCCYTM